ncbi:hypothetical protein JCM4814A_82740 [Streptomyces phaeofaciens JCM 4814]|uniref:Uncharacterized protein n=1 Tax=Streptomyces phaeofaciens TaxID=68254 RepID=A0A918HQM4_9ACTN|nr:hypothetical protein [Streptomyces phaeofaciens]GGT90396.1 hypothetical protein GCM10010226_80740 [Streptomyces phaeofaciens]
MTHHDPRWWAFFDKGPRPDVSGTEDLGPVCQSLAEATRRVRPEEPGGVVRFEPAADHRSFDLLPPNGLPAGRF